MKVEYWLRQAVQALEQAGIGTARLDALVLLEDVLAIDRARLLAEPEREITPEQAEKLTKLLSRRAAHEPLAYIRGHTEFYGRNFVITPAVLEPRPESETMIDLLKKLSGDGKIQPRNGQKLLIGDVGTGSGALGITAQLELPDTSVELLELDSAALEVAQSNVDKFTLSISVIESDLLDGSATNFDVLLCNLPYVPDDHTINRAATNEPKIAIFGGPDGLDLYRKLFKQLQNRSNQPLYILTESLPTQHAELAQLAEPQQYKLAESEDFIQVFKLAVNKV